MLMNDAYYAYDSEGVPSITTDSHNIIGCMYNGYGVCESYAKSYTLLMTYLGYSVLEITGFGNGGPHAWNMISIGNKYYLVDVTWDDDDKFGYEYRDIFFVRTQNEVLSTNETFGGTHLAETSFTYPSVSTTPYQE